MEIMERRMLIMAKIDVNKVLGIAGVILSLAGTIASGMANDKKLDETVAKKVGEALNKNQN